MKSKPDNLIEDQSKSRGLLDKVVQKLYLWSTQSFILITDKLAVKRMEQQSPFFAQNILKVNIKPLTHRHIYNEPHTPKSYLKHSLHVYTTRRDRSDVWKCVFVTILLFSNHPSTAMCICQKMNKFKTIIISCHCKSKEYPKGTTVENGVQKDQVKFYFPLTSKQNGGLRTRSKHYMRGHTFVPFDKMIARH